MPVSAPHTFGEGDRRSYRREAALDGVMRDAMFQRREGRADWRTDFDNRKSSLNITVATELIITYFLIGVPFSLLVVYLNKSFICWLGYEKLMRCPSGIFFTRALFVFINTLLIAIWGSEIQKDEMMDRELEYWDALVEWLEGEKKRIDGLQAMEAATQLKHEANNYNDGTLWSDANSSNASVGSDRHVPVSLTPSLDYTDEEYKLPKIDPSSILDVRPPFRRAARRVPRGKNHRYMDDSSDSDPWGWGGSKDERSD